MALSDGALDTVVFPQVSESMHAVQRHGIVGANLGFRTNEFHRLDVVRVVESDIVLFHGALDTLEGVNQVVEDGDFPLSAFALREALGVDQAHLLQHC